MRSLSTSHSLCWGVEVRASCMLLRLPDSLGCTCLWTSWTMLCVFMKKTSRSALRCRVAAWQSRMVAIWMRTQNRLGHCQPHDPVATGWYYEGTPPWAPREVPDWLYSKTQAPGLCVTALFTLSMSPWLPRAQNDDNLTKM